MGRGEHADKADDFTAPPNGGAYGWPGATQLSPSGFRCQRRCWQGPMVSPNAPTSGLPWLVHQVWACSTCFQISAGPPYSTVAGAVLVMVAHDPSGVVISVPSRLGNALMPGRRCQISRDKPEVRRTWLPISLVRVCTTVASIGTPSGIPGRVTSGRADMNPQVQGTSGPLAVPSSATVSRVSAPAQVMPRGRMSATMMPPGWVCAIHAYGTRSVATVAMIRPYGARAG